MNLEKIIQDVKEKLLMNNISYPLALVGSAVKSDKFNDIDFLMVVDNTEEISQLILDVFQDYQISILDDAVRIDGFSKKTISIALYNRSKVDYIVNNYMNGNSIELTHKSWCLGYWIPESFITNLQNMLIISDINNYFQMLKTRIRKNSIYAMNTIVKECLDEIKIKYELMKKKPTDSLEYNLCKNDVLLCAIRGMKILNGEVLVSYKDIDNIMKRMNCEAINKIVSNNNEGILEIIMQFEKYVDWSNKFYYGTWQFSGDFKSLRDDEIINLINYAKKKRIKLFDTALVYGKGKVERILGKCLEEGDVVVTKIPAKVKPPKTCNDKLEKYYDYKYIFKCIQESCKNLNKNKLDICLLHNWTIDWNTDKTMINYLKQMKEDNLCNKIGISLPNDFEKEISDDILSIIDVIEAPYNSENTWILDSIDKYKSYGIEIILRSLFLQGREKNRSNYENIIKDVKKLGTSITIGMTTEKQIDENIKILRME